ncbi:MAG TPA: FAD-dependent oxidoreductase, partial [Vicinamibacterales bacterium]|nr:FAD-dependent oxidoreductase [Vicinamibacterales bacterium]
MKHVPFWFDRFPRSRRPSYPRHRGPLQTRIAIVGGGLTGSACALTFAAAGIESVVLEADVVGGGYAGGGLGVVREGFAGSFQQASASHGLRVTRAVWDSMRRGSLDFAAALRRYGIKCDLAPQDVITIAPPTPEGGRLLRREYEARHAAGIEGSWVTPAALAREAGVESSGGIRIHGLVLDPYRACVGMAAAAVTRGAQIFEHSAVTRIRASKRTVLITTSAGTISADAVIVATGAPIADLRPIRRHLRAEQVYGVVTESLPAAVRKQVGTRSTVVEDAADPHRTVRWISEDRALVHGARQAPVSERVRERALIQRTGQLMYEFS